MEIRKLNWDDFDKWNATRTLALDAAPIAFGSSNEDEIPVRKEMFKRNMEQPDHFILGLFDKENLIGIAGFYRHNQLRVRHKGTIWSVFVHPDFQGKGLGRKLMEEMVSVIFEIDGLERILIGASSINPTAINLYKSLGFEEYGYEPRCLIHEGNYYDEVLMVLDRADYHKG
jgi:ribosomal protein S18 acetylase RimI-like enzyme